MYGREEVRRGLRFERSCEAVKEVNKNEEEVRGED